MLGPFCTLGAMVAPSGEQTSHWRAILVWCQAVLSYSFSVLKFVVVLDMELLLGCNLFNITYLLRSHPGKIGLDSPGYDPYALFQVLNFKMWVDCIIINMS